MTADEILKKHEDENEYHLHEVDRVWVIEAMLEYAKQEAIKFSDFKSTYRMIENMNMRRLQTKKFGENFCSWVGANNEKIWEAYRKGKQLKRYFEK